jgi:predicted nucleic acid-binding protein
MNLVDSCGWLEYLADGPNAGFFAPALEDVDSLVVPTICLYEVFKPILRQAGERKAIEALALMQQGMVVPLDPAVAVNAAYLSVEKGLPLADSVVLATARRHGAVLWTEDEHFREIEGVRYAAKT